MVEITDIFEIKDFSIYYGDFMAVKNITLNIEANKITAINRTFRLREIYSS